MGIRFSIDKHVSPLEDILELNPKRLASADFKNDISSDITDHIKIWRFFLDDAAQKIQSLPVALSGISQQKFEFSSDESYLLMHIHKNVELETAPPNFMSEFLWKLLESVNNLTPRGLEYPVVENENPKVLSGLQEDQKTSNELKKFDYTIQVFNGTNCPQNVKAYSLSHAFQLERLIERGGENILQIFFSGGVIRNKKLAKGYLIQIDNYSELVLESSQRERLEMLKQKIYLLSLLSQSSANQDFDHIKNKILKVVDPNNLDEFEYFKNFTGYQNFINNFMGQQDQHNHGDLEEEDELQNQTRSEQYQELTQKDPQQKKHIPQLSILSNNQNSQNGNQDPPCIDPLGNIRKFQKICSEVLQGQLYVSGEEVVLNKQLLLENGITHIINCAGDVVKNKFPDTFNYLTYYLKDSKQENIECVFYQSNFYIEDCIQNGGRVIVHCHQGVSRSITICISYLIWKFKYSFDEAFTTVKKARDIASPNPGFLVQALDYYKRICWDYSQFPINPKVFWISSHQTDQPHPVVAKMLSEGLYSPERFNRKLDPRTLFIIQTETRFYLWIGSEIDQLVYPIYQEVALKHIDILIKWERGGEEIIEVHQGSEPPEFWQLWNLEPSTLQENLYEHNKDWTKFFLQINLNSSEYKDSPHSSHGEQRDSENNEVKTALLFIYPDPKTPLKIFEFEDLQPDTLAVLCVQQGLELIQYVWRGYKVEGLEEIEHEFAQEIVENYYQNTQLNRIEKYKEEPTQESEEFIEFF